MRLLRLRIIRWFALGLSSATLYFPGRAGADCSLPAGYAVQVQGSTVAICPQNLQHRGCPDPSGMLRQDLDSGAVVRLPSYCAEGGPGGDGCYVDECVSPGSYRYGFATPYTCCMYCCSTSYFATATVSPTEMSPTDAGACAQTLVDSGPGQGGSVPWGSAGPLICGYSAGDGARVETGPSDAANDDGSASEGGEVDGATSDGRAADGSLNDDGSGADTATEGGPSDGGESDAALTDSALQGEAGLNESGSPAGDCSCATVGGARVGVVACDFGALAFGMALLARRGTRRRRRTTGTRTGDSKDPTGTGKREDPA